MRSASVGRVPPHGATAEDALNATLGNAAYKQDLRLVFAKLKSVGFNGLIMLEGVQVGATARTCGAWEATKAIRQRRRSAEDRATGASESNHLGEGGKIHLKLWKGE